MRARTIPASVTLALALCSARGSLAAPSSADELVRQARAHEEAHENDIALRRYTEALSLDPSDEEAWLGLGALRLKLGESAEAEHVYDAALERFPRSPGALSGRAHARWALGRHAQAEADLAACVSESAPPSSLRELASWYARDGRAPAQLAIWRRLLTIAIVEGDDASEARRMVRALEVLVDSADPVCAPASPTATRQALSAIARRTLKDRRANHDIL